MSIISAGKRAKVEERIRKAERREYAKRDAELLAETSEALPPLLVTMRSQPGIVIQFESEALALHLIRLGKATAIPKGDFALHPDVVIGGELNEFYEQEAA